MLRFCEKMKERSWFFHQPWLKLRREEYLVDCRLSFILVWKEKEVKMLDYPSFFTLCLKYVSFVGLEQGFVVNLGSFPS